MCSAGKCSCSPQFKGAACEQFNFVPLDLRKGTGLRSVDASNLQISSWGGSVHLADDGKYHMCERSDTFAHGRTAMVFLKVALHMRILCLRG
eukprot:SAG31_NODE_1373_length_8603_cov_4.155456_6_plen_92_part_00